MKAQQNTLQAAAQKQSLIQRMFRGCIRFLGTFLFIFFMTRNLLDSMGVNTLAPKQLTYIVFCPASYALQSGQTIGTVIASLNGVHTAYPA